MSDKETTNKVSLAFSVEVNFDDGKAFLYPDQIMELQHDSNQDVIKLDDTRYTLLTGLQTVLRNGGL